MLSSYTARQAGETAFFAALCSIGTFVMFEVVCSFANRELDGWWRIIGGSILYAVFFFLLLPEKRIEE